MFTRLWRGRGSVVLGVDPDEQMLAVARNHTTPGEMVLVRACGESLPVRDRWADVITFASSIHWLQPPAASREFARVLAWAGLVAMVGQGTSFPDAWPGAADLITASRRALLTADQHNRPPLWTWETHLQALQREGLGSAQTVYVNQPRQWSVHDLITNLLTMGAARNDHSVLPRLQQDLQEHIGGSIEPWTFPWRVVTVTR